MEKDLIGTFMKYWQFLSVIGGLVISLMYFVIDNINAHKIIANLSESNKILTEKVANLEGHKEGVDVAIKQFMNNPPGLLDYRISMLELRTFGQAYKKSNDAIEKNQLVAPK